LKIETGSSRWRNFKSNFAQKKTKQNFREKKQGVPKEPNCENGTEQRYLRAILNCVFQQTKKRNLFKTLRFAWNISRITETQLFQWHVSATILGRRFLSGRQLVRFTADTCTMFGENSYVSKKLKKEIPLDCEVFMSQ
jgi:hypothetical protein